MIRQKTFVEMVEKLLDHAIEIDRYVRAHPDDLKAQVMQIDGRQKLAMKLAGLYGMAILEGMDAGRAALLEEQAEEAAKAKRRAKRKRSAS